LLDHGALGLASLLVVVGRAGSTEVTASVRGAGGEFELASLMGDQPGGRRRSPGPRSPENEGIRRLRAEIRRLREDVAILKAATTFFVGELDPRDG
jgi:transposase-like protein